VSIHACTARRLPFLEAVLTHARVAQSIRVMRVMDRGERGVPVHPNLLAPFGELSTKVVVDESFYAR